MMFAVRPSAIHGQGLFAATCIPAGTVIGQVEGTPTREDGPHVLWLTDDLGLRVTNEMRFINHSDDANAVYYDDGEVVALRDIQPGEEITHHYDGDEIGEDSLCFDGDGSDAPDHETTPPCEAGLHVG